MTSVQASLIFAFIVTVLSIASYRYIRRIYRHATKHTVLGIIHLPPGEVQTALDGEGNTSVYIRRAEKGNDSLSEKGAERIERLVSFEYFTSIPSLCAQLTRVSAVSLQFMASGLIRFIHGLPEPLRHNVASGTAVA
jgi:hypothetical protein